MSMSYGFSHWVFRYIYSTLMVFFLLTDRLHLLCHGGVLRKYRLFDTLPINLYGQLFGFTVIYRFFTGYNYGSYELLRVVTSSSAPDSQISEFTS